MYKFLISLAALVFAIGSASAAPQTLLALGDSLVAGYGLPPSDGFTVKLEAALKAKGYDVTVINAGVAGDTAVDGASRLDWALTPETTAVMVELGANDALRGLPVHQAEQALDQLLARLKEKNLPVLFIGMRAPPNLGAEYQQAFDGMYPRLAAKHGVPLYPFFLEGVAADQSLNQADGIHPNAKGVDEIVKRILPSVEALLKQ
jgi:acyl-CoA thioesterase-1